ncbi:MFS transporter [Glutamicibacter sp. FBE19]|nr:MFS transporter [Glutamicibacter sp. FBE19]MBF6670815.1 MFS transporter [Glutamicibacter sp. FBE19]
MVLTGWCANQYVSLINWYQQFRDLSEVEAMLVMGSYLVGMIPALAFGGPLADRLGRKLFSLIALSSSIVGSLIMAAGALNVAGLYAGRVFSGLGMGLAMVAITSWVKLLSPGPAGATRAALCTSLGFAVGPIVSGAIVGFSAHPEIAYLVHALTTIAWLVLLVVASEEPRIQLQEATATGSETTLENRRRFNRVVLPSAPWVFGMAATGFAVVPALSDGPGGSSLLYSTVAVAVTMGMGTIIQPFVRRYNDVRKISLLIAGLVTALAALLLMIAVSLTGSELLGVVAFIVSGSANGILLVAGLSQVLDLAGSADVGKLTGRFYMVCFVGFTFPTLFASWRLIADPVLFIAILALLCLASIALVYRSRGHLPRAGLEEVSR